VPVEEKPVPAEANNGSVLSQLVAQNNEAKRTGDGSPPEAKPAEPAKPVPVEKKPVSAEANNGSVLSQLIAQNNEAKRTGDRSPYNFLQPGGLEFFGHGSAVTPIAVVAALLSFTILVCMHCRARCRVSSDGDLHVYSSVNDKDSQGGMSDDEDDVGEKIDDDDVGEKIELGGMHEVKAARRRRMFMRIKML
jgi:hypothetical protein